MFLEINLLPKEKQEANRRKAETVGFWDRFRAILRWLNKTFGFYSHTGYE